jgi:hypothetical protein
VDVRLLECGEQLPLGERLVEDRDLMAKLDDVLVRDVRGGREGDGAEHGDGESEEKSEERPRQPGLGKSRSSSHEPGGKDLGQLSRELSVARSRFHDRTLRGVPSRSPN